MHFDRDEVKSRFCKAGYRVMHASLGESDSKPCSCCTERLARGASSLDYRMQVEKIVSGLAFDFGARHFFNGKDLCKAKISAAIR